MFKEISLNDQQFAAATFAGGNLLLAAGPGSGKTHTMTARIIYLIEELHADPSSILVITFTRDAALSMQKRFSSLCKKTYPVAFGTFHSVFYHMICDHYRSSAPVLVFDRNKIAIAGNCIRRIMGTEFTDEYKESTQNLIQAISIYKNTLDMDRAAVVLPEEGRSHFQDMFRYYEGTRRKTNQMDFDDMVYDCRELLIKDKAFLKKWKNRFKHILIDEFQDINPVQYETVKLLTDDDSQVFAVGDDDQSIYGFRGASPGILTRYSEELNAQILHLDTNYRSMTGIVNASLAVIEESKDRIHKDLRSFTDDPGKVNILSFDDRRSQYEHMAEILRQDHSPHAVLFRTNLEMQGFASYLSLKGIPFGIREKTDSCFEHFIIRDIISYMKLATGEPDEECLIQIINRPQRYINAECVIGSGGDIDKVIAAMNSNAGIMNTPSKMHKLTVLKFDLRFMKNLSPALAVDFILKKIGYEKYIQSLCHGDERKTEEYTEVTGTVLNLASSADGIREFIELKNRYEEDLKKARNKDSAGAPVQLMTVHASKGLEFEKVTIPDCNEGNFPHGRMPDPETVNEERRIFYVGMTRAVSELNLFYVNSKKNSKYLPSRFLNPLANFG